MPLISTDPPAMPETNLRDVKVWLEPIVRNLYEDIKEIRNQLMLDRFRLIEDATSGDLIIEELVNDVWSDTEWAIVKTP